MKKKKSELTDQLNSSTRYRVKNDGVGDSTFL